MRPFASCIDMVINGARAEMYCIFILCFNFVILFLFFSVFCDPVHAFLNKSGKLHVQHRENVLKKTKLLALDSCQILVSHSSSFLQSPL